MTQVIIVIVGLVVTFWDKLVGLINRPAKPVEVPSVVVETVAPSDLLACLVDLRKRFAKDSDAVSAIDSVLVPSAVKMLSEAGK